MVRLNGAQCRAKLMALRRGGVEAAVGAMLCLVGLAVAATSAVMTVRCWSPLPLLDQWHEIAASLQGTWVWLASQESEHRQALPKLVLGLDRALAGGRNTVPLGVNVLLHLYVTLALTRLAPAFWGLGRAGALGLALSLVCWANAHEDLTWPASLCDIGVVAAAVAALTAAASSRREWKMAWTAAVCSAAAVFCFGSGLLVPPCAALVSAVAKRPRGQTALLAATAVVVSLVYFHGYHPPGGRMSAAELLSGVFVDGGAVLRFAAAVFGGCRE